MCIQQEFTKDMCDKILEHVSKLEGKDFSFDFVPDIVQRENKAVDFNYSANDGTSCWIEHSKLYSYLLEKYDDKCLEYFLDLKDKMRGKLPLTATFALSFKQGFLTTIDTPG